MKFLLKVRTLFFLAILFFSLTGNSQQWKISSDQWTATDGLGRKLPDQPMIGTAKSDKIVAMFYFTWHTDYHATFSPIMNITEILKKYPEAASDKDHPAWQGISPGVFWWDEPLFGYYRTTDDWILRKHAEMLADAGVDVIFCDCTNGSITWKSSYTKLLEVFAKARLDGVKTPQLAFILPFGANTGSLMSMYELYSDLYEPGLYKDLWFMWKGKPLIMAYPEELVPMNGDKAGLKFTASSPFYGVNASCPSWGNNVGNITFKIYKWNTNYATSVAGTPVAEKTFINYLDNQKLSLVFDQQEAGDYVWEFSDGTEQVGVWKYTSSQSAAISYQNGVQVSGNFESEISYTPELNFTQITTSSTPGVHTAVPVGSSIGQEAVDKMRDFFTFRPGQADYVTGPIRNDQWGWLENYPQHGFGPKADGGFEQVTVGVAQNASDASGGHASGFNTPLTYGRSYTKAAGQDTHPDAYFRGLNFQEQWSRAFELDPDLVFVTGWNEWIAGRWFDWDVKPFSFVDEYSAEKSRDIEPVKSWGNKGDVYYMQLVSNVRQFKGMQSQDTASASKTIDMDDLASWTGVKPEYLSYKGNTLHRNHAGQGTELVYTNTTGRNDIVGAKVARDGDYLYFYVETSDVLTDKADPKWMRLFIDIDRNKRTGWEGYDYVVNRLNPGDSAYIEKSVDSWNWNDAGKAAYLVNGKALVIKVKRSVFNLTAEKGIDFEFKWSDNMQDEGNIMDFYENGDVAPGERFNYVYKVEWSDDQYRFAELPENINHGLKCNLYDGIFDTIPSFFEQKISKTEFPDTFILPGTTSKDYGLNFSGFIDVQTKDSYTFTLNTGLSAKLFIGSKLVVESGKETGPQSGTTKLMPGKHTIKLEYITKEDNTNLLDVQIQGSSLPLTAIPSSMLFKYNESPSVSLRFNRIQNYFSPIDSVVHAKATDPDGSISKVKVYDNDQFVIEGSSTDFTLKNMAVGSHSIGVKAIDNNGAVTESNLLSFIVKAPLDVPGRINVEEYMSGKSVTIVNSTDIDGGKNIKVAYGWVEYPVNVSEAGIYSFTFRVPASTGSKKIFISSNFTGIGTIEVGNTVTAQTWYDVTTDIRLEAGIQVLRFTFPGITSLHRIDISVTTGINKTNDMDIRVTPNPSASDFLVQTPDSRSSIIIYDLLGKVVEQSKTKENSYERRIGSDLHPGIYLLVVTSTKGVKQRIRIIKK